MEDNKQMFVSSSRGNTYPIFLTKEELEAIPILLTMAATYSLELYDKTDQDKYYNVHKTNIEAIEDYHKTHQGIMAVGSYIAGKADVLLKDVELKNLLDSYMNKRRSDKCES